MLSFKALILICCTNIIKFFNTIITYKHPTYYIFKKKKKKKKHLKCFHKTKYDPIYLFDKCGSQMMYNNNVTL
jgi:hypothetical protein